MNLDNHQTARFCVKALRGESPDDATTFDSDDLTLIRRVILEAAHASTIPHHSAPLVKLADLITEALKP